MQIAHCWDVLTGTGSSVCLSRVYVFYVADRKKNPTIFTGFGTRLAVTTILTHGLLFTKSQTKVNKQIVRAVRFLFSFPFFLQQIIFVALSWSVGTKITRMKHHTISNTYIECLSSLAAPFSLYCPVHLSMSDTSNGFRIYSISTQSF